MTYLSKLNFSWKKSLKPLKIYSHMLASMEAAIVILMLLSIEGYLTENFFVCFYIFDVVTRFGIHCVKDAKKNGFLWPVFSSIRPRSSIKKIGKIRVRENPYFAIFYAMIVAILLLIPFLIDINTCSSGAFHKYFIWWNLMPVNLVQYRGRVGIFNNRNFPKQLTCSFYSGSLSLT